MAAKKEMATQQEAYVSSVLAQPLPEVLQYRHMPAANGGSQGMAWWIGVWADLAAASRDGRLREASAAVDVFGTLLVTAQQAYGAAVGGVLMPEVLQAVLGRGPLQVFIPHYKFRLEQARAAGLPPGGLPSFFFHQLKPG